MKLKREQIDEFLEKINQYDPPLMCPICHSEDFSLNDTIFEFREFLGGSLIRGGKQKILPVVPIICDQCGYTAFLNAIKYDLLKKDDGNK